MAQSAFEGRLWHAGDSLDPRARALAAGRGTEIRTLLDFDPEPYYDGGFEVVLDPIKHAREDLLREVKRRKAAGFV